MSRLKCPQEKKERKQGLPWSQQLLQMALQRIVRFRTFLGRDLVWLHREYATNLALHEPPLGRHGRRVTAILGPQRAAEQQPQALAIARVHRSKPVQPPAPRTAPRAWQSTHTTGQLLFADTIPNLFHQKAWPPAILLSQLLARSPCEKESAYHEATLQSHQEQHRQAARAVLRN